MKRAIAVFLVVSLLASGCPSSPPRLSVNEIKELVWLREHGYTRDGFDAPKNTALAVALDIFPLPGIGHFYLGYVGDGLEMMFLSWLVYPFVLSPIDAFRKASYTNDIAYLEYAHEHGWFKHPEGPHAAPVTPAPSRDAPPTSAAPATVSAQRSPFCGGCGQRFASDAEAFCGACGRKRPVADEAGTK